MALHVARELALEAWDDPAFGPSFVAECAGHLSSHGKPDPVESMLDFWESDPRLLNGCVCRPKPNQIVHVVRLDHVTKRIPALKLCKTDGEKCESVKKYLSAPGARLAVGHDGIAWFGAEDAALAAVTDARTMCSVLGMTFTPDSAYVALTLLDDAGLKRPTVFDGAFQTRFRPDCDPERWGCTVTRDKLELGHPEAVAREQSKQLRYSRQLHASSVEIKPADTVQLRAYVDRELVQLTGIHPMARTDLERSWSGRDWPWA